MAFRQGLNILFLWYFLSSGYNISAKQLRKPEIISEYETIIEANDNHTVFCQGTKPLKWSVPDAPEDKQSWTTFTTESEAPISPEFHYGLRLHVINMSYPFVGFYYCHYTDADKDSDTESSKIYLYVNDRKYLSVLEGGENIETVVVTQYEEAIIPCRPTSPEVHVQLSLVTGEEIEDTTYNPKTGFTLFVNDLSEQPIYICNFSRHLQSYEIYIHLTMRSFPVSHLNKPDLRDPSEGHTIVGNPLVLECIIRTTNSIVFNWITPKGSVDYNRMYIPSQEKISNGNKVLQKLIIANSTLQDKGRYVCNVTDIQGHSSSASLDVKVFDVDEFYLNLSEPNNVYYILASAGEESIHWGVDVRGHPRPTVTWLNNKNATIEMGNGSKYEANFITSTNRAQLKIRNIAITDFGNYTLVATNNFSEKILNLFLNVTDKPTVHIESDPFHLLNTPSTVHCIAAAYPEPEFYWEYKACLTDDCPFVLINGTLLETDGLQFMSALTINASESGYLKCNATNFKGSDEAVIGFYVSDIKQGFDVFGLDSTIDLNEEKQQATVALGETISVTCGASMHNYTRIDWLFNDQIMKDGGRYSIKKNNSKLSNKLELVIPQANFSDNGLYSCRVLGHYGEYMYKNISFYVANPQTPVIRRTNMNGGKEINIPDKLEFICEAFGIPKPSVTWYKNGVKFDLSNDRIEAYDNNERIKFNYTVPNDEGTYECQVRNKIGAVSKQQTIKFKNIPRSQTWLILLVIFLAVMCLGAIVYICIKSRKEKQLQRELKKLGLANFEKGAVENINPDLGIDDQAELLPYDQRWEFPIEHLKLGKQLGSGAFGVVMKGEAKNIVEGEDVTTVAVKMVKKNADDTYIRALASELKIMVHLGKHLNVVNLLGACTKNVAKRELLVIVEYCRFGNLQNYLLRHRDNYIDQVDPKTGKIDYNIGQDCLDRTYSVSSNRSNTQSPLLKYAALTFSNSNNGPVLPPPSSMGDYRANAYSGASANTEMTTVTQGDDGVMLSNNSQQPEWRSNYKGDYKGNVKPICTKDLLAWAFQVARGMDYLASRKVLHGDLAARNILLSDNNIVKICDFGLAKSMYKNGNYRKKGDGPLPVKWMAIESIRDRIFSTQSDVWSFGIVLWEFFSLAKTPYPGMEADERLYHKLIDGYRMEAPGYAPQEIYTMMTDCWSAKPLTRPSFTKLTEKLGSLLEDSLRKHYIDLNDPYLVMNTQRLENGQDDYLSMLSPPTFEALSSPHYVNEMVGQQSVEEPGYLSMKPNAIFSPRVEEGQMFDFSIPYKKNLSSEDGNGQELLPMLHPQSESECETPMQSPSPNSFSNPSYHLPPKISEENKNGANNNTEIVKSADNYVNMPQNKSIIKDKNGSGTGTNPFININSEKGDAHYVNSNSRDWESVPV